MTPGHDGSTGFWLLRAKYALLPDGRLLEDAAILGKGDTVQEVDSWHHIRKQHIPSSGSVHDLGEVLLLPAFLNAHCHLEFGFLKGHIPPGVSFLQWLEGVAGALQSTPDTAIRQTIRDGIRNLHRGGCAFIADISASGLSPLEGPISAPDMGFRFYLELIDFVEDRAPETVATVLNRLMNLPLSPEALGLSPHAPYTTTGALLREAARLARDHRLPLCIHCAETPEERQFCLTGDGPLRDFLDERHVLPKGWTHPGCPPVEWLDRNAVLPPLQDRESVPPVLLVHLNALDDCEVDLLSQRHVAAVVCPGTHQYFHRGPFPMMRLRKAGIPVALGTDSLGSNDGLSMWEEIRRAAVLEPDLGVDCLLDAATATAARALGLQSRWGQIAPGKRAVFTPIHSDRPIPPMASPEAREWLLDSATRPAGWIRFPVPADGVIFSPFPPSGRRD